MLDLLKRKRHKRTWEPGRLPRHVAIIMDGNGRWAAKRALPRSAGHAAGAETFRRVATYCKDIGIEFLTVYAFSTENWKRPADEVGTIMELLGKYLHEAIGKMERDKVRMKFFGDVTVLSPELISLIEKTENLSKEFEGVQVNICVNYGGRDEILRAVKKYATDLAGGDASREAPLTEDVFSGYMYSAGIPDPDLLVRTSEKRLSNFMLYQCAYTELCFLDKYWPDFDKQALDEVLTDYAGRQRRFGAINGG